MRSNLLLAAAALAASGLGWYWFVYEDARLPWQRLTRFEKEFPGCVSGVISGDYSALKLPTGFRHFYLAWGDNFPAAEINKSSPDGAILVLTWEPHIKAEPGRSLLGDIDAGKYDSYMAAMAAALKKYGRPVMLRWGHEPNGDWYAWSGALNGHEPETYIKAWRRMAGIMRTGAGPKVKLVFSVNGEDKPDEEWNRFENYYPGPEYADVVGLDAYNWGDSREWSSWLRPQQLLKDPYRRALAMAPDKPLFLAEVAACSGGGVKSAWLGKLFSRLETRYPAVKGFMWFDYDKECDWRISSDPASAALYGRKTAAGYFKADGGRLSWLFGE
ncbi:MAG: glycosyl hydrolase [Elusimicrobiota bacterium]|nr:glycosyl hydrolase [Elusimicrobiota bacterium]